MSVEDPHTHLGSQRRRGPRARQGVHGLAPRQRAQSLRQGRLPSTRPTTCTGCTYWTSPIPRTHALPSHAITSPRTAPYKEGPGFGGAWSNYPYFESGTVIVTSMQEGLFVLKKRVAAGELTRVGVGRYRCQRGNRCRWAVGAQSRRAGVASPIPERRGRGPMSRHGKSFDESIRFFLNACPCDATAPHYHRERCAGSGSCTEWPSGSEE